MGKGSGEQCRRKPFSLTDSARNTTSAVLPDSSTAAVVLPPKVEAALDAADTSVLEVSTQELVELEWHEAGGPEITEDEFYMLPASIHAQVRECLADPTARIPYGFAPRRALEAVLAVEAGISEADFKRLNAHRSWRELWLEANEVVEGDGVLRYKPWDDAQNLERNLREVLAGRRRYVGVSDDPPPFEIAELVEKRGPGARSGRLEDYTRAELCKLLGYLQRDAKDWSDDDLRAMALDAHLVPRWEGSPSHTELALEEAGAFGWGYGVYAIKRARSNFNAAMRMPYGKLARRRGINDDGQRSGTELRSALEKEHPLLVRGGRGHGARQELAHYCDRVGISTQLPEERKYRPAAGAQATYVSSLDARFGDAFRSLGTEFHGLKLSKVHGHGSTGTWRKTAGKSSGAWGFYNPRTQEIHLNPRLDKLVSKAQQGKAEPREVYDAVHTLTHEVMHAASARPPAGGLYTSDRSIGHTYEEGCTEALARLQTDAMARRMNLWSRDESLRELNPERGAYPKETETMVALSALASGTLDRDRLSAGDYAQPEAMAPEARQFMQRLHTETLYPQRPQKLAEELATRYGMDQDDATELVGDVLSLCKSTRFQFRSYKTYEQNADGRMVAIRRYQDPESLSGALSDLFSRCFKEDSR